MRIVERLTEKLLQVPAINKRVTDFVSPIIEKQLSVMQQPAEPQQETRPSRRSTVALDEVDYSVAPDVDTQIVRNDLTTYLELYQKLLWTFRGVNTIATSAARIPLKIWEVAEKRKEFRIHPIYKLLRNPNNLMTRHELFVKTVAYLELCGNAYWFIERDDHGLPTKLFLPRPDRVTPQPVTADEQVYVRRRQTRGFATTETWLMPDVVHFSYFNPLSDYFGFPPVAAGQDNAVIELYLLLFGKRFFQNAVYPSLMFKTEGRLSEDTFERFHAELRRLHQGVENFHKALILEEGMEPVDDRRKTPTDAEYIENRKVTREDILAGLGCYQLVALLQEKTGSALKEAIGLFWEETMQPKLQNIEETVSKELLWSTYPESEELIAQFDTRHVAGLRESLLAESLANYRYWQMGVYTGNEIRRELGQDGDTKWGDGPPPTIPKPRSQTLPNEERAFLEDSMPHPERYVSTIADNIADRLKNNNGNGELSTDVVKQIITEELMLNAEELLPNLEEF